VTFHTFQFRLEEINYIHKIEYLNVNFTMEQRQTLLEIEAEIFNAMAHPSRLEILELLREGEACVCHIQAMLGQRQAYISQHLNILRHAGLVTSRKEGLRVYYKISNPGLFDVMDQVKGLLQTLRILQPGTTDQTYLARQRKPCHCPQCSTRNIEVQAIAPQEKSYG
jgi:ArsR family transcriptional regulator